MAFKSSIHMVLYYMQSKEMYKLTRPLCRLARKEYQERLEALPEHVKDERSFKNLIQMIEHIEKSQFARAVELLGDSYKEFEDLQSLSHVPNGHTDKTVQESKTDGSQAQSIFEDSWQPPAPSSGPTPSLHDDDNKLNEDDIRNWRDSSPTFVDGSNDVKNNSKSTKTKTMESGDDLYDRRSYFTTLRPRDGRPDYERVYVTCSPTVLADRFQELYKTEWQTAFHELSSTLGEKQTVRHLLWIIAKASIICASFSTQQLQDLENAAVGIATSRDPLNKKVLVEEPLSDQMEKMVAMSRGMLIEYRREIAKLSVPMLQKELRQSIASELGTSLPRRFTGIGNHFIEYANTCIELIWLMYVHDPPMHLEWLTKEQEGSKFITDLYDVFNNSGSQFDYCVWPVVRMHKDGPVLTKGVAQGKARSE